MIFKGRKYCPRCKQLKYVGRFPKSKRTKDGLNCYCKQCAREKQKEYCLTPIGRYYVIKAGAKKRGRAEFLISKDAFIEWFNKQEPKCRFCNQPLDMGRGRGLNVMTLDRMDNNKPYTIDNIAFCCWRCNATKGYWFSDKEMLEIGRAYLWNKATEPPKKPI